MATYAFSTKGKAPGVYIQEITLPGPIAGVGTNVAAFVGPAKQGPLLQPTPLTSAQQFFTIFGDYVETPYRAYAAHAVNGFFAEGGTQCYFVRVGTGVAASLALWDNGAPSQKVLVVTAAQEGTGANTTTVQVDDGDGTTTTVANPAATPKTTANDKLSITVTLASDLKGFKVGDKVTVKDATNQETPTIASLDLTAGVVGFQSALTNSYSSGTITYANTPIPAGTTQLPVVSTSGLEAGTYIHIDDGTKNEDAVIANVNSIASTITLSAGLKNAYATGLGAAMITLTPKSFRLTFVSSTAGTEPFPNLSMDPRHSRYFANIVNSTAVVVTLADPPTTTVPPKNLPKTIGATQLQTGTPGAADNLSAITTAHYRKGIDALKKIPDVNLLSIPDAAPNGSPYPFSAADTQDIQAYMVAHCEQMKDRFAILDCTEVPANTTDFSSLVAQRQSLNSSNGYGAFYFPWIAISNPFGNGRIFVPPSGHVGGVYANNDNDFGVFKAPANEQITSALATEVAVTNDMQGPWNDIGINVIRSFPNEGVLIWGARTIAPPDITAWRFINVRRLVTFIEQSIQQGTRFAVFEPNNQGLWQQIKRLVTAFLTDQWNEGALFGDTPAQAFRVQVDEAINPPSIRALGQLVVQVTVVPTTPAEFIVFQVIQDITGASLQESTT
jgi:Bacteriophage tail sheath protein